MKLIQTIFALTLLLSASTAMASDPILNSQAHNGTCEDNVLCLALYNYNGNTNLHVMYEGSVLQYPMTAGILINGNFVGNATLTRATGEGQEDGGFISIGDAPAGDLAIYFFDRNGNYDSNESQNYHFDLQK